MSNENKTGSVSNELLIESFKENDKVLVTVITKIKNIYANTLMAEKKAKIDALRIAILEEDIKCQLQKMNMINELLNELEK